MSDTLLGGVFTLHDQKPEKCKDVLDDLIDLVKRCQTKYGGKKELATEKDILVLKLCEAWEKALSHGLKPPYTSMLKSVQDIVSGNNTDTTFWDFGQTHLTNHEKERFEKLQHVWTNRGKTKALIRSALNERSLERYMLMWLSDQTLKYVYESWALIQDPEAVNLLPSMAAGLSSILFAITIDTPEINVTKSDSRKSSEPVISAPQPVGPTKKSVVVKRQIVSFDSKPDQPSESKEEAIEPVVHTSPMSTEFCRRESYIENILNGTPEQNDDVFPNDTDPILSEDEALPKSSPEVVSNGTAEASTSSYQSDDRSSVISSTASIVSKTDVGVLEEKVKYLSERCHFLEGRVAQLSLENCNLRRLVNMNKEAIQFIVSIPRVVLLRSGPRKYYSYQLHINSINGLDEWIVLKRYSEFYNLHQQFQKNNPSVKALDFPPKKKIGNMDISFVEDRRQRLQIYLRHLLALLPEVSSCTTRIELQAAFPFLK